MNSPILSILDEAAELLVLCGWAERAEWFREMRAKLEHLEHENTEYLSTLREIEGVLGGMGSFSDLPLDPPPESGLTRREARSRQWALAEKLSVAIRAVLS